MAESVVCALAIVRVGVLEPETLPPSVRVTLLLFHDQVAVTVVEPATVLLAEKTALLPATT